MISAQNEIATPRKMAPFLNVSAFTNASPIVLSDPNESELLLQKAFIPTWSNKPQEHEPIMTLNGGTLLTYQNLTAIIASPGMGKSSICEAAAASYLNCESDCLGINVSSSCDGVGWIDFERTNTDVWNSFNRMCGRAHIPYGKNPDGVSLIGLRSIPRLTERFKAIEYLLKNNPCGLLILDGAGDLVTDTNDLAQAVECRIFVRYLTVEYNLSILTTLHPNPGSFKPRGHIGSEIHREAECVLVAKNYEGDCKILTSDFEHGKNRNHAPITGGYIWSDTHHMFISADIDEATTNRQDARDYAKKADMQRLTENVLSLGTSISYTDLISKIMVEKNKSNSTAKRMFKDIEGWQFITKGSDGNYRLTT